MKHKASFQWPSSPDLTSTGVKVKRKSTKDSGLLTSKKQVQNSQKASVQQLLASAKASPSDDFGDDVALDKLLPSQKKFTQARQVNRQKP